MRDVAARGMGLRGVASWRVGPSGRQALGPMLVAAAYYAGGLAGLEVRLPPAGVSVFWPSNAILLAALLLRPVRVWPLYLLAALPAHLHLITTQLPNMPVGPASTQFIGNMLHALIAAVAVRRFVGLPVRFDDLRGVTTYIFVAAILAQGVAAAVAINLLMTAGWVTEFWLPWRYRFLANVVPTMTLTPLILMVVTAGATKVRQVIVDRASEFGTLVAGLILLGILIGNPWQSSTLLPVLLYLPLPFLLWAAVRFGPIGLVFSLVIVAGFSLSGAFAGQGPVAGGSRAENVLSLQVFMISTSLPLMLLAALAEERRRVEASLRESQRRYSLATAAGRVGVWDWNLGSGEMYVDAPLRAMLGFDDAEIENQAESWWRRIHPEDAERVLAEARAHAEGDSRTYEVEHRMLDRSGRVRWFLARGMVSERENGRALRLVGTGTEITERKHAEEALRRSSEQVRELAGRLIKAQEEERRRIARDLHDDLSQRVASLSIAISSIRRKLNGSQISVRADVEDLQRRVTGLVDDIRELSHDLHPAILENAGLAPALRSFITGFGRLGAIEMKLTVPDSCPPIPPDVAICIYRVAQESIRNAVRHSGAKRIEAELAIHDDMVSLTVRDEGRGFDPAGARDSGGLGLVSIEERVRLVNGRLDLASHPAVGTTVSVQVPLRGSEPASALHSLAL